MDAQKTARTVQLNIPLFQVGVDIRNSMDGRNPIQTLMAYSALLRKALQNVERAALILTETPEAPVEIDADGHYAALVVPPEVAKQLVLFDTASYLPEEEEQVNKPRQI